MSSTDSHDDPSPEAGPASSQDALTPRGGFMARPGLKPPPRHAVVVRGGDAPVSEAIPVARSSFPPPAPSEPEPLSLSEKATLRAIPTAKLPRISSVVFDEPPPRAPSEPPLGPRLIESAPPPSDAPLVQSIPPESSLPRSCRRSSSWTILAAGAAGLLLGLASVLATRSDHDGGAAHAMAAASPADAPREAVAAPPKATPGSVSPAPSSSAAHSPRDEERALPAPPATPKPAAATVKKSIF